VAESPEEDSDIESSESTTYSVNDNAQNKTDLDRDDVDRKLDLCDLSSIENIGKL